MSLMDYQRTSDGFGVATRGAGYNQRVSPAGRLAMTESRTYLVSGRVQGVGFRWFAWDAATREGLLGFVRNLPDGSVEAVAEGDRDALDRFEWKLSSGPRGARVDHVNRETGPATGRYQDFSIKG